MIWPQIDWALIGSGAILKRRGAVSGTATAAAIWTPGAIGAAVPWDRYESALMFSLVTFATLRYTRPLVSLADHTERPLGKQDK